MEVVARLFVWYEGTECGDRRTVIVPEAGGEYWDDGTTGFVLLRAILVDSGMVEKADVWLPLREREL